MEQKRTRNRLRSRLTYQQWKRRKTLRLVRNWALFLAGCAAAVFLMTKGILWLLPQVTSLVRGPEVFAAQPYDGAGYVFDRTDPRLALVNGNLPYTAEPEPLLSAVDEAGSLLEAEAAMAYRSMAAAAQADDVTLIVANAYQAASAREAAYENWVQTYLEQHKTQQDAEALAASIEPRADRNEHGTGYAVDLVCEDYDTLDLGFAETKAYEWLTAYAAEYGFILRYPQDRQAATGVVYEPWHWRYVGKENALAIRASALSLEEFLATQMAD